MLCSVCGKDHPVENIEKSFRLPDVVFALPTYEDTFELPLRIVRKSDTRPFFFVISDHPLKQDQQDGISEDMPIHYAHL